MARPLLSPARIAKVRAQIGLIEGHELSDEQISAIAGAGPNTLVLAGAGTGKTTTIVGYVAWLLATGSAQPDEILVLSYTKASADEMSARIRTQTGQRVRACTFHSLGLDICRASAVAPRPVAPNGVMMRVIGDAFAQLRSRDPDYSRLAQRLMPDASAQSQPAQSQPDSTLPTSIQSAAASHLLASAATIITHLRANGLTCADLRQRNAAHGGPDARRNGELIDLIEPLAQTYDQHLRASGSVDFSGMIADATRCVQQGRYEHPYRYVLIDEYQDMSRPRYRLVRALREQHDFSLFAVGDDWQSIYRFAGSDIRLILDFDCIWRDWGPTRLYQITVTRRFRRSLIDASGAFVMADGHLYAKRLRSAAEAAAEGKPPKQDHSIKALGGADAGERCAAVVGQLRKLPKRATVLLLGRYANDLDALLAADAHGDLAVQPNAPSMPNAPNAPDAPDGHAAPDGRTAPARQSAARRITLADRPDLDIAFMTVHASKGLQRDFVFLLSGSGGMRGFPSAIPDDALLGLLLPQAEAFPHAEERRLFYVAMTRCIKKLFLVVDERRPSRFMIELRENVCPNAFRGVRFPPRCPNCGESLELKTAHGDPSRRFYGCSAWPACTFTKPLRG